MQSFGKTDTALTEDGLFAAMHREMDALEAICDSDPAETWEAFAEGLRRLLALVQEAHKRKFLPLRRP